MQGDQNSPGIIPLAIKDVFSMIQDVSFLANLVIIDFLNYIGATVVYYIMFNEVHGMSLYPFCHSCNLSLSVCVKCVHHSPFPVSLAIFLLIFVITYLLQGYLSSMS